MSLLLEGAVKVSLILLIALAAGTIWRTRSAAARHWLLSTALVCAAIAPLLALVVPAWHLRLGAPADVSRVDATHTPAIDATRATDDAQIRLTPARDARTGSWSPQDAAVRLLRAVWPRSARTAGLAHTVITQPALWLGALWLAGTALCLLVLVAGLARLAWLASRATPLSEGRWRTMTQEIADTYGLGRPIQLLESDHPTLLVTWGLLHPKVIVPTAARDWSDDRVRVVLCHELAHIRRRDWLTQMGAELLRCLYWFNPLLWLACARLRQESEQAADDEVLNLGVAGSEYAAHLVEVARALGRSGRTWSPAAAIARPSGLERRIRAMLNVRLDRAPVSRVARLAMAIALLSVTLPLAAFTNEAQTASAQVSGVVVDPHGKPVPHVTVTVTNVHSGGAVTQVSDQAGRFEVSGLTADQYRVEVALPGFVRYDEGLTLAEGQAAQRNIRLQLGSLRESIMIAGPNAGHQVIDERVVAAPRVTVAHEAQPVESLTGGRIDPPKKTKDVRPAYPTHLSDAGVEGTVVLEARIGLDGTVSAIDVVTTPHPELAAVASEAVRGWQYTPTLLNGEPVDVRMIVTVSFKATGPR